MTRLDKIVTKFGEERQNTKNRFNSFMENLTTKYPEYFHWTAYIPVAFFLIFLRFFGVNKDLVITLQFIAIFVQFGAIILALSYGVPRKYRLKKMK